MKLTGLVSVFLCAVLGGCSTHFYKVEGNEVAIYLKNPDGAKAMFMCSLDGYAAHNLKKEKGAWVVNVPTDKSFRYFYMVDGEQFIPPCPLKEKDDFGSENCIFETKM